MNSSAADCLWALASNTLMALPLAILAFVLTRRRKLPSLAHACWILVLVKLVTPPLLPVQVPLPKALEAALTPETTKFESSTAAGAGPVASVLSPAAPPQLREAEPGSSSPLRSAAPILPDLLDEQVRASAAAPAAPQPISPSQPGVLPKVRSQPTGWDLPVATLLLALWGGGAVFLFLRGICLALAFRRQLRSARPAPGSWRREAQRLARILGLRRAPRLRLVPGRVSPMPRCCFSAPVIVLPASLCQQLDQNKLQTLLAHELAHLRRRDHWVRQFEWLLSCVLWFHPLLWWSRRQLRLVEEDCCDAWVLWALPQASRCYADTLIDTVAFLNQSNHRLPAPASGMGQVQDLSRRLNMIMTGNHERRSGAITRGLALGFAALSLSIAPVAGQHGEHEHRAKAEQALQRAVERLHQAEHRLKRHPAAANNRAGLEEARVALQRARDQIATHTNQLEAALQLRAHAGHQDPERARQRRALQRAIAAMRKSGRRDDARVLEQMLVKLGKRRAATAPRAIANPMMRMVHEHQSRRSQLKDTLAKLQAQLAELDVATAQTRTAAEDAHRRGEHAKARKLHQRIEELRRHMAQLKDKHGALAHTARMLRSAGTPAPAPAPKAHQAEMKMLFDHLHKARDQGKVDRVRELEHRIMQMDRRIKAKTRDSKDDSRIRILERRIDELNRLVERMVRREGERRRDRRPERERVEIEEVEEEEVEEAEIEEEEVEEVEVEEEVEEEITQEREAEERHEKRRRIRRR